MGPRLNGQAATCHARRFVSHSSTSVQLGWLGSMRSKWPASGTSTGLHRSLARQRRALVRVCVVRRHLVRRGQIQDARE